MRVQLMKIEVWVESLYSGKSNRRKDNKQGHHL